VVVTINCMIYCPCTVNLVFFFHLELTLKLLINSDNTVKKKRRVDFLSANTSYLILILPSACH